MTSGEILKKELKLSNIQTVKICRLLGTPVATYIIYYNSRVPNHPITQSMTRNISNYFQYNKGSNLLTGRDLTLTPLLDIEDFNGSISSSYFINIDLIGEPLQSSSKFKESTVETFKEIEYLYEATKGFTVKDLINDGLSDITSKYYSLRKADGTTGSFLNNVIWNQQSNVLQLIYHVNPTYSKDVKVFKIGSRGSIKLDKSSHYTIRIQFEQVSDYLLTRNKKEFFELTKKEQMSLIRDLINNGTVKVFGNDMSFLFQGMWERGSDLDYTVYKYKGIKGKGEWWARHNKDIYVSKHIKEVLTTLPFVVDEIRKKIDEKYNN